MLLGLLMLFCLGAGASAGITWLFERHAKRNGILDNPNPRSSHTTPTPRGGGMGIPFVVLISILSLSVMSGPRLFGPAAAALLVIAGLGWLEDSRGLSARTRLAVQFCAAAIIASTHFSYYQMGHLAWVLGLPAMIALVWSTNLHNFMDGIDGFAGAQGVFIGLALFVLSPDSVHAPVALALSCACVGFLTRNWPPARVFMGDGGSLSLGFIVGLLVLWAALDGSVSIYASMILTGAFWIDATVTLVMRAAKHDRLSHPHRSHAYQRASRILGSHRPVAVGLSAINCLWLLPWAMLAQVAPAFGPFCLIAAVCPLVVLVLALGAGRADEPAKESAS